jgi:hypothetical protein
MDQENASELLRWIVRLFGKSSAGIILYEPIGGHDAFGKVMIRNLAVLFFSNPALTSSEQRNQSQNFIRLSDFREGNDPPQGLWICGGTGCN